MADFTFYQNEYKGDAIPVDAFPRMMRDANAHLEKYKRDYSVRGDTRAEGMALCAMAEALYYYETAANGGLVTSASVGSVSSSVQTSAMPDTSPKAQAAELYRCALLYLDIYRGASRW